MGDQVLIICFVVVVIGGIGSVKGALVAALLIGLVDTFGKVLELEIGGFRVLPELAGMSVYLLMAVVLLWRPEGLFGEKADDALADASPLAAMIVCLLALALAAVHRRQVLRPARHQDHDHGDLRHEPRPAGRATPAW